MSADRLSFTPSLPRLPALDLVRGERGGRLVARRSELLNEEAGRVIYYANAHEGARGDERPLLLLHGMHLGASAQELAPLFDTFRAERQVYALDLPGFGASDDAERSYLPEHYVSVMKQLIEQCACDALAPVDVVAVGLTCEHAARAAVALPEMVHTLTLVEPTGFAHGRDVSVLERVARNGGSLLPHSVLRRLGLLRFCGSGFASVLSGAAFPPGSPQAIYTRVHCPTLVLYGKAHKARYGTLARFVRWREHYSACELPSVCLGDRRVVTRVRAELARLFGQASEATPLRLRAN